MKLREFALCLAILSLAGCNAFGRATPSPQPIIQLDGGTTPQAPSPGIGGGVTASGYVVPARRARLAYPAGGIVERLNASVGERVEAGAVLASLAGREELAAALESASLELLAARQALEQLYEDLPEEQNAALQALTAARQAVRDAERRLRSLNTPAEDVEIDAAWANVVLAREKLDRAREDFQPYEKKSEDNVTRAALLSRLAEAQALYDDAVRRYNLLAGVAGSEFDRSQAEAELRIAQQDLELAEQAYEELQIGPDPDRVAMAEARLRSAEAQLEASRKVLAGLELKAPFDGTVSSLEVHEGEWVAPGQPLLELADLDHLLVETADLSERDAPAVEIGQAVTVYVEALDREVAGRVSGLAPLADILGGDVVYEATIELGELPPGLRAGMSVEVYFASNP